MCPCSLCICLVFPLLVMRTRSRETLPPSSLSADETRSRRPSPGFSGDLNLLEHLASQTYVRTHPPPSRPISSVLRKGPG